MGALGGGRDGCELTVTKPIQQSIIVFCDGRYLWFNELAPILMASASLSSVTVNGLFASTIHINVSMPSLFRPSDCR